MSNKVTKVKKVNIMSKNDKRKIFLLSQYTNLEVFRSI